MCCLSSKLRGTMARCPSISPFFQCRGTALSLPSSSSPMCLGVFLCEPNRQCSGGSLEWKWCDEKPLALSGRTAKVCFTPDLLWVQTMSLECEAKFSTIWMFNSDWCIKLYRKTNMFWWSNLEWRVCLKLWLLSFLKAPRSLLLYKVMAPGSTLGEQWNLALVQ